MLTPFDSSRVKNRRGRKSKFTWKPESTLDDFKLSQNRPKNSHIIRNSGVCDKAGLDLGIICFVNTSSNITNFVTFFQEQDQ